MSRLTISRLSDAASVLIGLFLLSGCGDPTRTVLSPETPAESTTKPPSGTNPPGPGADTLRSVPWRPTGAARVVVARADGSAPRSLAKGTQPTWSPAGDLLAFTRDSMVCVIRVNGSDEQCLVAGADPSWSPDGLRLAYTSRDGISIMNVSGTAQTLLVSHGFRPNTYAPWDMGVSGPSWSPDGATIAFVHNGDGDMVTSSAFLVPATGGLPRRVTNTLPFAFAESPPRWSPDGSSLVFWSYNGGITMADPATGRTSIVYGDYPRVAYYVSPRFTPGGQAIAFTLPWDPSAGASAIWTVATNGGALTRLIDDAADPTWSPDGQFVAFVRKDRTP